MSTLSSSGSSPDLILREVEHLLQEQLKDGHYLTIVYAVLDLKSRSLSYINAGHCPPLLLRSDGAVEYLDATRTVLGLGIGGEFEVHKVRLSRGDRLAFYTDGITEAANGDAIRVWQRWPACSVVEREFARAEAAIPGDSGARACTRSREAHR